MYAQVSYQEFKNHANSRRGLLPLIVPVKLSQGWALYLHDNGITLMAELMEDETPGSDWLDFQATIFPQLDTGLTVEGYAKKASVVVPTQPDFQIVVDSTCFELPTDAEAGITASEATPVVTRHRYKMPENLNLRALLASWEAAPRMTNLRFQVGWYIDLADESTFQKLGEFTGPNGTYIFGTCEEGAKFPPESNWAATTIYAQVIPSQLSPYWATFTNPVDTYIRISATRIRPCLTNTQGTEIKPFIDMDFDFFKKL